MLNFGNKEFRNLQEQVLQNANELQEIKQSLGTALPNPIAGPQGPKGDTVIGPRGERGSIWTVGTDFPASPRESDLHLKNSEVYQYTNGKWVLYSSIKGSQGVQGVKGNTGDIGPIGPVGSQGPQGVAGPIYEVKGILNSIEQLPAPSTVAGNYAYIIGSAVFGLVDNEWAQITTTLIANIASQIGYDNTTSGLSAANVQRAIDELADTNLESGSGINAIQMKQDGDSGVFNFTDKNPNATLLDHSLIGDITYGATGDFATVLGGKASAQGKRSMAQGTTTIAKGKYSHAEGDNSVALGNDSHAEGYATVAYGTASHAEGNATQAKGEISHAEGFGTQAIGTGSHTEGVHTQATGDYAHAGGLNTMASYNGQTVIGHCNDNKETTVFEVGNGWTDENGSVVLRRNAFEVYLDGHAEVSSQGTTPNSVVIASTLEEALSQVGGGGTKLYKHTLRQPYINHSIVFVNTIETAITAEATRGSAADINLFASALAVYIFVFGEDIYTNTAYKAIAVGKYGLGKIRLYYLTTSGDLSSAYDLDFTTAVETIEEL